MATIIMIAQYWFKYHPRRVIAYLNRGAARFYNDYLGLMVSNGNKLIGSK